MNAFSLYTIGLPQVFNFDVLSMLLVGVISGVVIGALPGLTATMGVAVMTPLTYGMSTIVSFALLLGVYCGGIYGGSITAIIAKIPGTPSSIMTALEGHPMTLRGEAGRAIGIATISSFIGGVISVLVLSIFAPVIARVALAFSAQEYFAVALFGISVIAYISTGSMVKGLISGFIGLLLSTIGTDPVTGFNRFTFNNLYLLSGLDVVPILIGIFGLSEILSTAEQGLSKIKVTKQINRILPTKKDMKSITPTLARGSLIGVIIGAIPAAGGTIAAIVAYGMEKRFSKHPEKFGTGIIEGIAAPESANNATSGSAMIPMLTLGIPGDAITAILISALLIHGLRPGPMLFENNPEIVSAIFIIMALANLFFLFIGLLGARLISKIINIRMGLLLPIISLFCFIGAYSIRNSLFDVGVMILFGAVGYLFNKGNFPSAPLVLGLILGPMIESNFRQTLIISQGDILSLFTRPISGIFIILTILLLIMPGVKSLFEKLKASRKS